MIYSKIAYLTECYRPIDIHWCKYPFYKTELLLIKEGTMVAYVYTLYVVIVEQMGLDKFCLINAW